MHIKWSTVGNYFQINVRRDRLLVLLIHTRDKTDLRYTAYQRNGVEWTYTRAHNDKYEKRADREH